MVIILENATISKFSCAFLSFYCEIRRTNMYHCIVKVSSLSLQENKGNNKMQNKILTRKMFLKKSTKLWLHGASTSVCIVDYSKFIWACFIRIEFANCCFGSSQFHGTGCSITNFINRTWKMKKSDASNQKLTYLITLWNPNIIYVHIWQKL